MARFNPDFWEIPTDINVIDRVAATQAMWFETDLDRERRYAMKDFFAEVSPTVREFIDAKLTARQRQILTLYYFQGKTQEDIAAELDLTQSTVSRHLFGTVRDGKKVGGAIPKLRKVIEKSNHSGISRALSTLQERMAAA
ncbi:MAG: sigma-70 family RNA polymerase sigma factor [Candidatus Hydrogenedentes bacterium]|nr:sigma-70 family RNA polymerase sigma factor [Candidatus Hydrogenedentota bacterium]